MKTLARNKQKFYYALYENKENIQDEYGNLTGEYKVVYSKPKIGYANISASRGETESSQFGQNFEYDKIIMLDNTQDLEIDEHSILWIENEPTLSQDEITNTPYDYIVKKIAKSINSTTISISKVVVNQ